MNEYELGVYQDVAEWKRKITKKSGMMTRLAKKAQTKISGLIPEKVHRAITEGIKAMVKATLFGSQITTKRHNSPASSLAERDELARKKIEIFKRAAMVEGAGTGAGGILLGLADFPILLTIKMKFLFEIAAVYGYDTSDYSERLFILHVFQLAFSSDDTRIETLDIIENWQSRKNQYVDMDWRRFQQEYRDHIDLSKMLQLVPGIGAIVGAYANNNLLTHLGNTAMNAYRLRILTTPPQSL